MSEAKEIETKMAIAAADDTPTDILEELSKEPESQVRYLVASNPNTPVEILQQLGEEFPEAITANPVFALLLLEN